MSTVIKGALGVGGLVVVARVMRKGLSTYTERRKVMDERIRETQSAIHERNQTEPPSAQAALLESAVREVISLAGLDAAWNVRREAEALLLCAASGCWRVRYVPKSAALRTQKRVLHGTGHWEVCEDGGDAPQRLNSLDSLIQYLDALLRHGGAGGGGVSAIQRQLEAARKAHTIKV